MREAILIHMGSAREAIEKKGILSPTRNIPELCQQAQEDQAAKKPVSGTGWNFWNFQKIQQESVSNQPSCVPTLC
jgi:hypothetical protein